MTTQTRRWMMRGAIAVFVAALAGYVFLRTGRPLYYTDGRSPIAATELVAATQLVWDRPRPETELPGPVEGRVQPLPDGRYLYARRLADGSTDLVVFDPAHRDMGAIAPPGLNAPGHDLSPALAPDGGIVFASDRDGGAGGFDLWSARLVGLRVTDVHRLPDGINTELDETDACADPDGGWVFVRRDPNANRGQNGRLILVDAAGGQRPVFEIDKPNELWIDRDPWLAPDGTGLWFVRHTLGEKPVVMRTWRHAGQFVEPFAMPELALGGEARGPVSVDKGFGLMLVKPTDPALVYRASAHEVYPWWEGQRDLERLLILAMIAAVLILLLLQLGKRFRTLDFITWCVILSLLVHLLVLWLLRDVQLVTTLKPVAPYVGGLEVDLVSSASGGSPSSGGAAGDSAAAMARELQFSGHADAPTAVAPGSEVVMVDRTSGDRATPDLPTTAAPAENAAVAKAELTNDLKDAAPSPDVKSGHDVTQTEVAASPLPAPAQDQSVTATGRTTAAVDERIVVNVPGSAVGGTGPSGASGARVGSAAVPAPDSGAPLAAGAMTAPQAGVSDAPSKDSSAIASRSGHDGDAAPIAPSSTAGAAGPSGQPLAAKATRPAPPAGAGDGDRTIGVAMPGSAVESGRSSGRAAPELPSMNGTPLVARGVHAPTAGVADGIAAVAKEAGGTRGGHDAGPAPLKPSVDAGGHGPTGQPVLAGAARRQTSDLGTSGERPASVVVPGSALERGGAHLASAVDVPSMGGARFAARSLPGPSDMPLRDAIVATGRAHRPGRDASGTMGSTGGAGALRPLDLPGFGGPASAAVSKPGRTAAPTDDRGDGGLAASVTLPGSLVEPAPRASRGAPAMPAIALGGTVFQNRFGPGKVEALEKFGGTRETEAAVAKGLAYLARIQNKDGSWGDPRTVDPKYGHVTVGKTGLCLLAFLGAGHAPGGDGPYAGNTTRAVNYLLKIQDQESGHFGETSSYSHGISTYALAECFGLTKDARLKEPVQRAVDWIVSQQNRSRDKRSKGGWGYFSASLSPEDGFARTSISAWQVMALESAKLSGFRVRDDVLPLAKSFLLQEYDAQTGCFLYNREPSRLASNWRTLPASTPAAVFALLLLGTPKDDGRLTAGLEFTLERRPTDYRRFSSDEFVRMAAGNVYFWYYGSLACFMAGGDTWTRWNAALKQVLPRGQSDDGSFEPIDEYARLAGDTRSNRAYTTAMCVLSLEVYYRYFTPLLLGR